MRAFRCVFLMMMMTLPACGGNNTSKVDAYLAATDEVRAVVDAHRQRSDTVATREDCQAERRRYIAEVRPRLDHLKQLSGDMDGCMRGSGHMQWADMARMCDGMNDEVDDHEAQACTAASPEGDRQETFRHCAVMDDEVTRARQRGEQSTGCGGEMMGRGGMM